MTTYYVGIGGSDANNGLSWANRKLTLNGAEDVPVAAGDTVYVGDAGYVGLAIKSNAVFQNSTQSDIYTEIDQLVKELIKELEEFNDDGEIVYNWVSDKISE